MSVKQVESHVLMGMYLDNDFDRSLEFYTKNEDK